MKPVTLTTARLVLDQPTLDDVDRMTEYCQDPIFETYLSTPWPYRRSDAEAFIGERVLQWWADEIEFTWAIRCGREFIGVIGWRTRGRDLGFWLGEPNRGRGYMTEAVGAVLDWVFEHSSEDVQWECYLGNRASLATARKSGFTFRGVGPAHVPRRDGSTPPAWKGSLAKADTREPKAGWPEG